MARIAVLGAGPAGLVAALEAAEAGHDVVVFEAREHVGGMAGSFEVFGVRVDYGSHRLHAATDASFMVRLRGLLGDDLQARERNGRILLRGRWVGFPLRMLDMARSLPLDFSAGVAMDTVKGLAPADPGVTFEEEIVRRLGPVIYREFYAPYAQKLYGLDGSELDAELADRRVAATSPLQILAKVVHSVRPDGRLFWYPKRGYGQLCERLADAAADAGVDIRLATPVEAVGHSGTWVSGSGSGRQATDLVLSTIPLKVLARVIEGGAPASVTEALLGLKTRAMVLVYLTIAQDQYTPYDAHYFPETAIRMSRLSEPKNYRDGADPIGRTVLCGEYPCWPHEGDEIWTASDDELSHLMLSDLRRSELPNLAATEVTVRRLPAVYPVYEPGTAAQRQTIDDWAASLVGVLPFGRQGLWVPDNIHHVMAMGAAAVSAISADGVVDRTAWQAALGEFAHHVVQD